MTEAPSQPTRHGTSPGGAPGGRGGRLLLVLLAAAGVVALLALTAWVGWQVGRVADRATEVGEEVLGEGPFTRVGPVTVQQIRALAELTTVEVVQYTTVEKGNDRGWLNWARGDRIAMFAVARIGAGVDLDRVDEDDIDVDPEAGRARLRLPPAAITYVEIDSEATHVFDRDTGLFTRGDPDLERAARLAAEEVLVDQALADGLLERAERRAEEVLSELIRALGYSDVEVVVQG